jgi:hypothetical protein
MVIWCLLSPSVPLMVSSCSPASFSMRLVNKAGQYVVVGQHAGPLGAANLLVAAKRHIPWRKAKEYLSTGLEKILEISNELLLFRYVLYNIFENDDVKGIADSGSGMIHHRCSGISISPGPDATSFSRKSLACSIRSGARSTPTHLQPRCRKGSSTPPSAQPTSNTVVDAVMGFVFSIKGST